MKEAVSEKTPAVGVICEFNPLHNGHVYLLAEARRLVGEDGCVICVMSGRSTQRGEPAMIEPFARARMALTGGADLVLELPFPWCSGGAEIFARGGVHILSALGIRHLIFGSECGDIELLSQGAECIRTPEFMQGYAAFCREGMGTAAAYERSLHTFLQDLPADFPASNDILGLAYLATIQAIRADMTAHTIKRRGQDYRDELLTDVAFPSATSLRRLITEAYGDPYSLAAMLEGTMPAEALDILLAEVSAGHAPVGASAFYSYAHMFFRLADISALQDTTAEMGSGLGRHLQKCALASTTPEAFISATEIKQYTRARLRRAMLYAVTGVTEADIQASPVYTQVLGANARGRAYLSALRRASEPAVQVITKPADAPDSRQKELSKQLDALFTICMPQSEEAGWLMKKNPHMVP